MRKAIKPTYQLLFCLLIPLLTYFFSKHLEPHIPTSPFLNLPLFVLLASLTAASYIIFGSTNLVWSTRNRVDQLRGAIAAYGCVVLGLIVFRLMPNEAVHAYLTTHWLYSVEPLSYSQSRELLPEAKLTTEVFTLGDLLTLAFYSALEEGIFRGLVLSGLAASITALKVPRWLGLGVAVLASSISFALYHDFLKIAVSLLNLTTLGIIAGVLYLRFGLFAAALYHVLHNFSGSPHFLDANGEFTWPGFWFIVGSILALLGNVILLIRARFSQQATTE